jgi:hypothetical protein
MATKPANTAVEEDPFGDPASGDFLNKEAMAELNGSLWLVKVHEYEQNIPTEYSEAGKDTPAIRADVIVLDGEHAGRVYESTLIFGRRMVPQLKPRVGKMIVGRLTQGEKKKGKNAPWVLDNATPEEKKTAKAWLDEHEEDPFN